MLLNYFKVALRAIKKHPAYSFINISGLVFGLAIFMLFGVSSGIHYDADKFHTNAKYIYGVVQAFSSGNKGEEHTAFTPAPLLGTLLEEFPEITDGTRVLPLDQTIVKHQDRIFFESGVLFVDPDFLSIFTFNTIVGDASSVLSDPFSIVVTERAALKYFGDKNPIGQILTLDNRVNTTVTGVIQNPSVYSSIQFDFLASMETARSLVDRMDDWKTNKWATFVMLSESANPSQVNAKFQAIIDKHFSDSSDSPDRMYLYPFLDFHVKSVDRIDSFLDTQNSMLMILYMSISGLVLLIVCINFMNLSTAQYMNRVKEIGMRKVVGAKRLQLIRQFLVESVILALIALPIALLVYRFMMLALLAYIGVDIEFSIFNHPFLIKYLLIATVGIGLFAGSYPAFFLSGFKPVQILKRRFQSGRKGSRVRRVLVVSQFTFAIILIVGTMVIRKQYNHLYTVDFGYDRNQILVVPIPQEFHENLESFQKELVSVPGILSVSASESIPPVWMTEKAVLTEGLQDDEAWMMNAYGVDYSFSETMDIQIVQGRSFSRDFDDSEHYILNETAVRQLQWDEPIGKSIKVGGIEGQIIGVAKDFLFTDLDYGMGPVVLFLASEARNFIIVKHSPLLKKEEVAARIEAKWKNFAPFIPFESFLLEEHFSRCYRYMNILASVFGIVDVIAVLLSCMGIFGLASYAAERRTKEIGVRKVLGASTFRVIRLLMKEFLLLIAISNLIGLPIAYFISDSLMASGFTYGKVPIGVEVLLIAGFITLFTAIGAVTSRTVRAARANPADSLRYE
jgi:putative ABC transport system permease protein